MSQRLTCSICIFLALMAPSRARSADAIKVMAAGSLQSVEHMLIEAFNADNNEKISPFFGPAGLLRNRIEQGEPADILASADMEQPKRLVSIGWAAYVAPFVWNSLCLYSRPGIVIGAGDVLDRLLDPSLTLATSTPKSDPGGDYTWAAFSKADSIRPGAASILDSKAKKLMGGADAIPIPAGRNVADYILTTGKADLFIAYCSGSAAARSANQNIGIVEFPDVLRSDALYGLAVHKGAPAAAFDLALFHLSTRGQAILAKAGFRTLN